MKISVKVIISKICKFILSFFGNFILVTISTLSLLVLTGAYSILLFYPFPDSGEAPEINGAKSTHYHINLFPNKVNRFLDAWYYKNAKDQGLIIVSHGNAGNILYRTQIAQHILSNTKYSVLLYDYQGYGNSTGQASTKNILSDGLQAYKFATETLSYKPENLILYGESMGCAVSSYIASEKKCEGLILQSPFISLPEIAKVKVPLIKIFPEMAFFGPKLNNEKALQNIHIPLLIMHGTLDALVPVNQAAYLYKNANNPKTFISLTHSGHNDICENDSETYDQAIRKFTNDLEKNRK